MEQVNGSSGLDYLVVLVAIAVVFIGLAMILKVIEWAGKHGEWFDENQ